MLTGSWIYNKYPDGSSYVELGKEAQYRDKYIYYLNDYESLWRLGQLVDAHNNISEHKTPTIYIPNLIDAQHDKRFNPNESNNLKLVCKFLNSLDAKYVIFHPHNPEVVEALLDRVSIVDNTAFIEDVIEDILHSEDMSVYDLVLMSSDAGGFKPLMKLADKIRWKGSTYSASKSRKWNDGKSELIQVIDKQDFESKNILIVDDLCVRGGTFIGLAKMLQERKACKLFLAVSHITIEQPNPELFKVFDGVYTTTSKYGNYFVPQKEGGHQPDNITIYNVESYFNNHRND